MVAWIQYKRKITKEKQKQRSTNRKRSSDVCHRPISTSKIIKRTYLFRNFSRRSLTTWSSGYMPKYTIIYLNFLNISLDMAAKILNSILFTVNFNDCKLAEFVGHASIPYNKIGKNFDLINAKRTSSDALRPIFPKCYWKPCKIELCS